MKISLLTDAPNHNLALMKISSYHKALGDTVKLNMPLWEADIRYVSILFEWNRRRYVADIYGGIGMGIPNDVDSICPHGVYPDYGLFQTDFSLGYTYRFCPRNCSFCKVTGTEKTKEHTSIWTFHKSDFKKICLLNNNTFFDPLWKETFEEIWDAKLIVRDENGYDLRLVDEEKAIVLKKTRWDHGPKFAWDRMEDEEVILKGFKEINRAGFKGCTIYVLIGYNTTLEQDIYRCQKIHDLGHNPFPMIYKEVPVLNKFRRMIYARYYRASGNIEKAWKEYSHGN